MAERAAIALLAVYYFVFTAIFRASGLGGRSFLLLVAVALWPWLAVQEGLQRATVSFALVALAAFGEPVRFEGLLVVVPLWLILAVALIPAPLMTGAP